MTDDTFFSKRSGHRLLKSETNQRVSPDAGEELVKHLEEEAEEIAAKAREFAEHADRKTIRKEDVEKAVRLDE